MADRSVEAGLGFLERCAAADPLADLIASFLEAAQAFGFDACAAGAWGGVGRARAHRFYFNSWPQGWLDLYNQNEFFHHDPMIVEVRRRMSPFTWSQMGRTKSFTPEGSHVVAAAHAFGWREVMGVPVHGPFGYEGLVSLGALKDVELGGAETALLRTMALAIHDRCREAIGFGEQSRKPAELTARELECMQWVAAGKTDVEIGIILSLSKGTAHFHVEQVKRKMDVRTRTEAVALLALDGLI